MSRRLSLAAVLTAATLMAGACSFSIAGTQIIGLAPSYVERAEFPSTIGLYPGSFVRQLGIDIGQVSKVENQGDHVLVTMKIFNKDHVANDAKAILVGDSVLGERYVQFSPAYIGGPALPKNSTLGLDRVVVPVETDQVLRSLNTVIRGVDPANLRQFTINLATLLDGQGAKLNELIGNAAGTVQLLANKSAALGQLTTTLAQLTGQLGTRDQALAALIQDYDALSASLAADRSQLDGTISALSNVTTQATGLLQPNLAPIEADVASLTTVGQTLDRNVGALDIGVKYSNLLFSAAKRAYDPQHNWLPLNSQANPNETTAVLAGDIRDSLASVCRRLAQKNPALGAALAACGNPNSGFFNPIIGLLPSLVKQVPGGSAPSPPAGAGPPGPPGTSTAGVRTASSAAPAAAQQPADAQQAIQAGLAAIPGLTAQQRQQLLTDAASVPAPPATATVGVDPAAALPPEPALMSAPVSHHRGIVGGFLHWLGGLL